jgi:hypothetical protein
MVFDGIRTILRKKFVSTIQFEMWLIFPSCCSVLINLIETEQRSMRREQILSIGEMPAILH